MKESIGNAIIPVVRKNGADGEVTVKWRTIDKSAMEGRDFTGGEGVLTFRHTEVSTVNLSHVVVAWWLIYYFLFKKPRFKPKSGLNHAVISS